LPENFKLHYPILWNLSSFIDIERYRETRWLLWQPLRFRGFFVCVLLPY
jgi:hypothetical protein